MYQRAGPAVRAPLRGNAGGAVPEVT